MTDTIIETQNGQECCCDDYSLTVFCNMVKKAAQLKPEQKRDVAMMINGYLIRDEAG